jgi:hypothetical protein
MRHPRRPRAKRAPEHPNATYIRVDARKTRRKATRIREALEARV